jgi:Leucine Rich Repeat
LNWHALHLNGNEFTGSIPPDLNSAQLEELYLHNNKLTGTFPANSFANDFAGESLLREVSLYNNNLEGRLDEMCYLVSYGKLQVFEVDLDKTPCQCCSPAPL